MSISSISSTNQQQNLIGATRQAATSAATQFVDAVSADTSGQTSSTTSSSSAMSPAASTGVAPTSTLSSDMLSSLLQLQSTATSNGSTASSSSGTGSDPSGSSQPAPVHHHHGGHHGAPPATNSSGPDPSQTSSATAEPSATPTATRPPPPPIVRWRHRGPPQERRAGRCIPARPVSATPPAAMAVPRTRRGTTTRPITTAVGAGVSRTGARAAGGRSRFRLPASVPAGHWTPRASTRFCSRTVPAPERPLRACSRGMASNPWIAIDCEGWERAYPPSGMLPVGAAPCATRSGDARVSRPGSSTSRADRGPRSCRRALRATARGVGVTVSTVPISASAYPFGAGGGDVGNLVRTLDWAATSLGAIETWPQSLRTTVGMVLRSPVPIVILWGEDGIMIYNDAYSVFAGNRHRAARLEGARGLARGRRLQRQRHARSGWRAARSPTRTRNSRSTATAHRERVWMNLEYSPVLDEAGRPAGVIAIVVETTERVLAERRAAGERGDRARERRARAARPRGRRHHRHLALGPADRPVHRRRRPSPAPSASIRPWAARACSLEQIIETVHPDDRDGLIRRHRRGIARGGAYAHQYRVRRADGNYYWIEANGRVDHAPDGTPLQLPGRAHRCRGAPRRRGRARPRDRDAAGAQRDAGAARRRAHRRTDEGRGRAAPVAEDGGGRPAHRRPRARLQQPADRHHRQPRADADPRSRQGRIDDVDRYIDAAQGAAKRAAALTHRLLAFSRRQTLDPKPTDVNRLVAGMEDLIRRTVGPAIDARGGRRRRACGRRWSTRSQLENALLNLCINARDAMPDGGRITIETANKWLDDARRARARPAAGPVRLALRDRHRHRHAARRHRHARSTRSSPPSRSARAPASACR